jgi:hypothetical protein
MSSGEEVVFWKMEAIRFFLLKVWKKEMKNDRGPREICG